MLSVMMCKQLTLTCRLFLCRGEAAAPLMAEIEPSRAVILSFHVAAAAIDGGNKVSMCCF